MPEDLQSAIDITLQRFTEYDSLQGAFGRRATIEQRRDLVFLCLAPVFVKKDRFERAIRWLLALSFAAMVVALIVVSASRGIDRGDLFEIIVISIVWLTLIVAGPLLAVVFRRAVPR